MPKTLHTPLHTLLAALVGAGAMAGTAGAQTPAQALRQQLVGTWSLVEQWVEQDGRKVQRFGANPKGIAIYDGNGRFATILLRADLPRIASNNALTGTADENRALVHGSNATYGSWSVDEQDGAVVSQIDGSTFPNWDGQRQRRKVSVAGDEMTMCVAGAQIGGTACAVWRRSR